MKGLTLQGSPSLERKALHYRSRIDWKLTAGFTREDAEVLTLVSGRRASPWTSTANPNPEPNPNPEQVVVLPRVHPARRLARIRRVHTRGA